MNGSTQRDYESLKVQVKNYPKISKITLNDFRLIHKKTTYDIHLYSMWINWHESQYLYSTIKLVFFTFNIIIVDEEKINYT